MCVYVRVEELKKHRLGMNCKLLPSTFVCVSRQVLELIS